MFVSVHGTWLWQGMISVAPQADGAPAVPECRTWGWVLQGNGDVGSVVSEPWLKRSCVRRVPVPWKQKDVLV